MRKRVKGGSRITESGGNTSNSKQATKAVKSIRQQPAIK